MTEMPRVTVIVWERTQSLPLQLLILDRTRQLQVVDLLHPPKQGLSPE